MHNKWISILVKAQSTIRRPTSLAGARFKGWHYRAISLILVFALHLMSTSVQANSCGSVAFMQFKLGTTNRIKFGTGVLYGNPLTSYGDIRVFRQSKTVIDADFTLESCSCSHCDEDSHSEDVADWPIWTNPTNIVSGGFECGTVAPAMSYSGDASLHANAIVNSCVDDVSSTGTYGSPGVWTWSPVIQYPGCYISLTGTVDEEQEETYYKHEFTITGSQRQNWNGCGGSGTRTTEITLDNEYLTESMVGYIEQDATNQVDAAEWSCSGGASFSLSEYGTCGDMTAMKFRFKYLGPKDVKDEILLEYRHSLTIRKENSLAQWTTNWIELKPESVTYTGRPQTSKEFLVLPKTGMFDGGMIRSSSVSVGILNQSSCAGPGWGGSTTELRDGPYGEFGLGDCMSSPAGFLFFEANGPSLPSLEAFVNECVVESPAEGEYKVGSKLAKVTTGSSSFTVSYYSDAANVPASHTVTYTVSISGSDPAILRVASSLGGHTDFIYTNGMWFLDYGDGDWSEGWSGIENGTGEVTNETYQVLAPGGGVLFQETTTYIEPPGVENPLISTLTTGVGAEALTQRWFYNTNVSTGDINYAKLIMKVEGNQAWKRFEYLTNGLLAKTISTFGNAATNAAENTVRVEEYDYSPFHPNDDGSINTNQVRVVYEKLKGTIVRMRGTAYWPNGQLDVQFAEAYFGSPTNWAQAANLKSYTTGLWYTNGTGTQVIHPNGTVSLSIAITNVPGTYRTNFAIGGAADSGLSVTNGTRKISVTSVSDGKLRSSVTYDVASGQSISQESYSYFGTDNRSYIITYLDTTTQTYNYSDCCSALSSSVDREGVTTDYLYDLRKRQSATKSLGIVISNVLDAAGNIVETWRYPSNSAPTKINAYAYDTLGREKSSSDALNNVTTNWYAFAGDDRFITTNKYADGSTRVQYLNKDGSLERVVGTAAFPVRYSYDVDATAKQRYVDEIKLDGSESDTSESTRNYTDAFGREYKTLFATPSGSNPYTLERYNNLGQMEGSRDADGNWTYYTYNTSGELYESSIDMDGTEARNDNVDRTFRTLTSIVQNGESYWVRRTLSYQLPLAGGADPDRISEVSLNGLRSWEIHFGRTNKSARTVSGTRTVTVTAPDGSYSVSTYAAGRVIAVDRYDKNASQIGGTTLAYDTLLRQWKSTDARNGSSYVTFDNADRVTAITNPPAGIGETPQVTQTVYDSMGRATNVIQPDATSFYSSYYANGLPKRTWGSRAYPVEYTYDAQGRLTNMLTWQSFSGDSGKANTSWKYDPHRGFLASKRYADGQGPSYTNTPNGRLQKRTWARNSLTTTYAYNPAGQMVSAVYSDNTSSVTNLYSHRGFLVTSIWGTNVLRRLYHNAGVLLSETLDGMVVSNRNDSLLRRTNLAVLASGTTQFYTSGYAYDAAGRLESVTDGTNSSIYTYIDNSPLVSQITFKSNNTVKLVTTKTHDFLNRLTRIDHSNSVSGLLGVSGYAYNSANQRTSVTNLDGSYWMYQYDSLGQVTSGRKYWANGTAVLGQQFDYTFDDIGNRQTAVTGGNEWGSEKRYHNYTANTLNQYTQRSVPGYVDVLGSAGTGATVTVNYQRASRQSEYWRRELAVDNSADALWLPLTNYAVWPQGGTGDFVTNATGNTFVPKTPEVFSHDADGNLTSDGRWAYVWDGENRLLSMTASSTAPSGSRKALHFDYDPQGRRISKVVSNWTGSAWTRVLHEKYFYNGWNLLSALNGTNDALVRSFTWGSDLSGSMQGAGGVGGLLMVRDAANGTHFYGHDGNGNVVVLVNAQTGTNSCSYEYGPFGDSLRANGLMARVNPFRFSSKFQDDESDLLYYGYRYYCVSTGRWISKDPIGEIGGRNLYTFLENQGPNSFDVLGMWSWKDPLGIGALCDWIAGKLNPAAGNIKRPSTDNNKEYKLPHIIVKTAFSPSDVRDLRWHLKPGTGGANGRLDLDENSVSCCGDCTPIKCVITISTIGVQVFSNRPSNHDGGQMPARLVYGHEQKHYKNILGFGHNIAQQILSEPATMTAAQLTQKYNALLIDFIKKEMAHSNPGSPQTYEGSEPELYPNWSFEKQQEDRGTGI